MGAVSLSASSSLLRCARRRGLLAASLVSPRRHARLFSRSAALGASDPLRILFFSTGDGLFSNPSLQLLHTEMMQNPSLISAIDVVTSPPKRVGRGHRELRRSGPDLESEKLELPVHLIGGFEDDPGARNRAAMDEKPSQDGLFRSTKQAGFKPGDVFRRVPLQNLGLDDAPKLTLSLLEERQINLLIAVSYGRFIPAHFIRAAKHGGLNLHPSLLPRLRGAAPIQWAIARDHQFTGVSLQTLDEREFDRGLVLAQTPEVALNQRETTPTLQKKLSGLAAALLVEGLRAGLHDEATRRSLDGSLPLTIPLAQGPLGATTPREGQGDEAPSEPTLAAAAAAAAKLRIERAASFAPKIGPQTLEMRWDKLARGAWQPEDPSRRSRAFGSLRTRFLVSAKRVPERAHTALQPTAAQRRQQKEMEEEQGQNPPPQQQQHDLKFETVQVQVLDTSPVALEWLPQAISSRILELSGEEDPEELLRGTPFGPPLPEPDPDAAAAAGGDGNDEHYKKNKKKKEERRKKNEKKNRLMNEGKSTILTRGSRLARANVRVVVAEVVVDKATGRTERVGLLCLPDADGRGALIVLHELLVPHVRELLGQGGGELAPAPDGHESYSNVCVRVNKMHIAGHNPVPAWSVIKQCGFVRPLSPTSSEM
ncbi:hypothetical protein RB601_009410 [Gaeumannomyces tritici]